MGIFRVVVLTPAGKPDPSMAIAASMAGELGVLNLEHSRDRGKGLERMEKIPDYAGNNSEFKLDGQVIRFFALNLI